NLNNLQELDLSSCSSLQEFKLAENLNLNNLQKLNLNFCSSLQVFEIDCGANLKNLQKIHLNRTRVKFHSIAKIIGNMLPNLKMINLQKVTPS
ncbi:MAG: hypothetical protein QG673_1194, partial [Pseudomonadota bacterium]|nr:hypothetical protein [Pseudomonadota bacterium]